MDSGFFWCSQSGLGFRKTSSVLALSFHDMITMQVVHGLTLKHVGLLKPCPLSFSEMFLYFSRLEIMATPLIIEQVTVTKKRVNFIFWALQMSNAKCFICTFKTFEVSLSLLHRDRANLLMLPFVFHLRMSFWGLCFIQLPQGLGETKQPFKSFLSKNVSIVTLGWSF